MTDLFENPMSLDGFELVEFSYSLGDIKRKWIDLDPYGNGFFILK